MIQSFSLRSLAPTAGLLLAVVLAAAPLAGQTEAAAEEASLGPAARAARLVEHGRKLLEAGPQEHEGMTPEERK